MSDEQHKRGCLRFEDDDWNSSTLDAYVRQYGALPPCTCDAEVAAELIAALPRMCPACGTDCDDCGGSYR